MSSHDQAKIWIQVSCILVWHSYQLHHTESHLEMRTIMVENVASPVLLPVGQRFLLKPGLASWDEEDRRPAHSSSFLWRLSIPSGREGGHIYRWASFSKLGESTQHIPRLYKITTRVCILCSFHWLPPYKSTRDGRVHFGRGGFLKRHRLGSEPAPLAPTPTRKQPVAYRWTTTHLSNQPFANQETSSGPRRPTFSRANHG